MIEYIMAALLALLVFLCFSDAIFSLSPSRSGSDSASPRPRADKARDKNRHRVIVLPLSNRRSAWDYDESAQESSANLGERFSRDEARAAD